MFNLMPGQGLAAGNLGLGLGQILVVIVFASAPSPPATPASISGGGGGFYSPGYARRDARADEGLHAQIRADLIRQQIIREDQEVMDLIVIIVNSGLLQ